VGASAEATMEVLGGLRIQLKAGKGRTSEVRIERKMQSQQAQRGYIGRNELFTGLRLLKDAVAKDFLHRWQRQISLSDSLRRAAYTVIHYTVIHYAPVVLAYTALPSRVWGVYRRLLQDPHTPPTHNTACTGEQDTVQDTVQPLCFEGPV
jgi:hypothetical protein